MFVCVCQSVTDTEIIEAVDSGVTSFDAMQESLSVAKACGSCACEVKRLLQQKLQKELSTRSALPLSQPSARL